MSLPSSSISAKIPTMPETSFKIVPSTVWELSERVNDERRERLLKTPFDKIVEMIIRNGKVGKVHYERNKATISNHEKRSLKRYYVEIELPTKVVDLLGLVGLLSTVTL